MGLATTDLTIRYRVLKAQFDQARLLWLQSDGGDLHRGDSSLAQARALLDTIVARCEQHKEHKALQILLIQARDTLASVLISLCRFADARDCLVEYVSRARLELHTTTPTPADMADMAASATSMFRSGADGCQASLMLAMRVLDLSMLEGELGNVVASGTYAKAAWDELVCLAGDVGARLLFAHRAVAPPTAVSAIVTARERTTDTAAFPPPT